MALTQQLSPAGLSLLQLFMPTLTPLSPCHLKYPHLSWVPFHRDYTIWRKWINHQGVSKAHERVNSQGLPAFRRRPAGCSRRLLHRFVKAKTCICRTRRLLGFCQRHYFLFAALHTCQKLHFANVKKSFQIWQKTKWEQASQTLLEPLQLFGFKEVAQTSKVINQFATTWVASI